MATATASKKAIDDKVTANATAITAVDAKIVTATTVVTEEISACKENGYAFAQANLKKKLDKQAADDAAAATVKADYDAKSAFSTSGETNTLCAYPAKAKDAAQEPRPKCADTFCCGAA